MGSSKCIENLKQVIAWVIVVESKGRLAGGRHLPPARRSRTIALVTDGFFHIRAGDTAPAPSFRQACAVPWSWQNRSSRPEVRAIPILRHLNNYTGQYGTYYKVSVGQHR